MADKRKKLKRQVSTDGGFTWSDLIPYEYIAGELIQKDSPDCNNIEWRTVSGYICEENTTEMTQWVADTGYVCVGFDKYNKEKEQVSYNSGISWADTGNTKAGSTLIEKNSFDCGYVAYRWVADTGYVCVGYNKMNKEKEQSSTDGINWTDTGNTRAGSTIIEANSIDCGYTPSPYSTQYLTTEALGSGNIKLKKFTLSGNESKEPITNIQYSKNGGDWTDYYYSKSISVVTGDKIRWKGTIKGGNNPDYYHEYYSYFESTADYKAYGNPLSLLKNDGFVNEPDAIYNNAYYKLFTNSKKLKDISGLALPATTLAVGCYYYMFEDCTGLTTVPSNFLPATTLKGSCYKYMFSGCTGLTTTPALPATTLAWSCYEGMFGGCKSLTTAPELPATTLAGSCYESMFGGCTGLATVPSNLLPATTLAVYCYQSMFGNCTSLTTAPELPATTLAKSCYESMFWYCTSLTAAPALPATMLAESCYEEMFKYCESLTTAPALPATTMVDSCYREMFRYCTSLTVTPELPATGLAENCYEDMFYGCVSLTTVQSILPATTMVDNCYQEMFHDCTSLTTVPTNMLPATTLARGCYSNMFGGCTSLTVAPELPATTLAKYCYYMMFIGCTSLNYIKCLATNISADGCTYEWTDRVSSTGTFVKASSITSWKTGISGIPSGWTVVDVPEMTRWVADAGYVCVGYDKKNKEREQLSTDGGATWTDTGNTKAGSTLIEANSTDCGYAPSPYSTQYLTTEALEDGNIGLRKGGSDSKSKEPITDIQYSKNNGSWTSYTYGTNISIVTGDKIRWKGTLKDGNGQYYYSYFYSTASYKAYGNPLSLLNNDSFVDEPDTIYEYAYYMLFYQNKLKDASNLVLPATTLAASCYESMFDSCASLTTAPALPATTLAASCYESMFGYCRRLTTAPVLPATTLADSCYKGMFYYCDSLTTAPVLPAITLALANYCYENMFWNCTSLTTAPALPATTLAAACYRQMFRDCTSLTTPPALPSTKLATACYAKMFERCTFTTAPALPATTLADYCYQYMFHACYNLTTAPALPAITLVERCYSYMFGGCRSLNYIKCLATNKSARECTYEWTDGVSSTGTFVKNAAMSSWGTGIDGIPKGWTVQDA